MGLCSRGPSRSLRLLLWLLLVLQGLPPAASLDLSAVPQCGLDCLITALPTSPCDVTDEACLCADVQYNDIVTACVVEKCTIRESLTTKNATWSGCGHPTSNRDTLVHGLSAVFLILPVVALSARFVVKWKKLSPWGADDTTICISAASCIVFIVCSWLELDAGLGRDMWTLDFDKITRFLQIFFICEVMYTFCLAMIKASFLFFFLRVFPNENVRIALWATVVFNALLGVTFVIVDLAQCRPIDYFWNNWDGEHPGGTCININAMAWSHAAINVVLDIWMLVLPAIPILKLQMSRRKKASVLAMFGVGVFLTAVSIVRLSSLLLFGESTNPTVDYFGVAVYSTMELHVGVTCACMPAVYQLTNHLRQKYWPSTSASSDASASEPNKTIGRITFRKRKHDTYGSTTLQATNSMWSANTKHDGLEDQQPSQTCLVVEMDHMGKTAA